VKYAVEVIGGEMGDFGQFLQRHVLIDIGFNMVKDAIHAGGIYFPEKFLSIDRHDIYNTMVFASSIIPSRWSIGIESLQLAAGINQANVEAFFSKRI
jgi:hypothetical protein